MKTDYQQNVEDAQIALDKEMENYWSNPANADGGSPDDRYKILYRIAQRYDVDVNDLNN